MATETAPEMAEESKQILADPNVVMVITRTKNQNCVVYRAVVDADGKLNKDGPIEVFWLKIDPAYIKANRDKGVLTDKKGLNFIESTMAYGVTVNPTDTEGEFEVIFVANPKTPALLKIDPADGLPKCFGYSADGTYVVTKSMFVSHTDNFIGIPTVHYALVKGHRVDNGEPFEEKIIPS